MTPRRASFSTRTAHASSHHTNHSSESSPLPLAHLTTAPRALVSYFLQLYSVPQRPSHAAGAASSTSLPPRSMSRPKPLPGGDCGDDADDKYDCAPSPPSSHGSRRIVTALVVTASVLVFFFLVFSVYCFVRRRRRRQRREALLAAAPAANVDGSGAADEDEGEVVHHAWHIMTVGLDEAAIESIALTRYRAGAGGMLGAADCSVCLAEFVDGELFRLLPKCGHAFHVPCIDTWLRAHVNCPLCRAAVLDPATAGAGEPAQPAGANTATATEQATSNTSTMEDEVEQPGQQQGEEQDLRVEIDRRDQFSSRRPTSRAQIFRRVASMNDSSLLPAEEDKQQNSKAKQGRTGHADCCKLTSGSGRLHYMRSLSGDGRWALVTRHCRTRSAVLPL